MTTNLSVFAHLRDYEMTWTNRAATDWHDPVNWSPNLVPNEDDTVLVTNSASITVNGEAHCRQFFFGITGSNPALTGSGSLTIHGSWTWSQGFMLGSGKTIIAPGATLTLPGNANLDLNGRTLENGGTVLWTGTGGLRMTSAVSNTTYRLEVNPDLNPTNWTALSEDVTAISHTASKLDVRTSTNRFYRVRVLPK